MTLKYPPWGKKPQFEIDEFNEPKLWRHGVRDFEVIECFENTYTVGPHRKCRPQSDKYGDRYTVRGQTHGGRRLVVHVQYKGAGIVRPITAWEE